MVEQLDQLPAEAANALEQARLVTELWLSGIEVDDEIVKLDDLLARCGFKGSL